MKDNKHKFQIALFGSASLGCVDEAVGAASPTMDGQVADRNRAGSLMMDEEQEEGQEEEEEEEEEGEEEEKKRRWKGSV